MTIEEAPMVDSPASLDALIERIHARVARVGLIGTGYVCLLLVAVTRNFVSATAVTNGRLYKA